ncbi:MAG: septum formation inhibitor Maf [Gammaproteobacteria bacterium]|nr:septum formation inhibitor Maf [Gammaproteobacteria bacterium]MBT6480409.1 septum formation inhibitor Maf [Gammaproteobacteria bacterium]
MEPIILASASARRQELLAQIGISFTVRSQDIDESIRSAELAEDYVMRMAMEKAMSALRQLAGSQGGDDTLVLAADTSVVCDADVLGKPSSESDALEMLLRLSGREHRVLSAVMLATKNKQAAQLSESRVTFREISLAEARRYYASGEPEGKAGSYAIQGYGAVFVKQLHGSYSGVMGLPLFETAQLLAEFGVSGQPPIQSD